jgi:hypothetical protein
MTEQSLMRGAHIQARLGLRLPDAASRLCPGLIAPKWRHAAAVQNYFTNRVD